MNALTTLMKADAGSVRVAGHDVATETKAVRAAIGVTGQFAAVDELLTGQENLRLMVDLKRLETRRCKAFDASAGGCSPQIQFRHAAAGGPPAGNGTTFVAGSSSGPYRRRPAARAGGVFEPLTPGHTASEAKECDMAILLLLLVLALVLAGVGFAIHVLWWIALVVFAFWLVAFMIRGARGGRRRR